MAFSKLKALLRKAAARTKDDLWDAIATTIDSFSPTKCENHFAAAGYDQAQLQSALGYMARNAVHASVQVHWYAADPATLP